MCTLTSSLIHHAHQYFSINPGAIKPLISAFALIKGTGQIIMEIFVSIPIRSEIFTTVLGKKITVFMVHVMDSRRSVTALAITQANIATVHRLHR